MDVVLDKRMSAELKDVFVPFADGMRWFAEGYDREPWVHSEIAVLERQKAIPRLTERRIVELEEIRAIRTSARMVDGASDETGRRIEGALIVAAGARASDLVLEVGEASGRACAIVNDRKYQIGDKWRAEEMRRAMRKLFFLKEGGSQQTTYQERANQGFSIRNPEGIRMPTKVSALRGERGASEPAGEHMFLRLFYSDTLVNVSLERLGFAQAEREVLERQCRTLRGATVIGGVTGDGKSTTLATCLVLQQRIFDGLLNMVTVEDPVEQIIEGAIQIAVSTAAGGAGRDEAFASALRHFCRINPAVGMVSEIRDMEAARQVMRFVDTGHQVWTTIHAGDANGIVFRLLDLGVPPEQVCNVGNLSLLIKQTIVSELCEGCRRPAGGKLPHWMASDLGTDEVFVRNEAGCAQCRKGAGIATSAWSGYRRRRAVAEMITPDAKYLEFVRRGEPNLAARYWVDELGGVPVHRRVRDLVLGGAVDPNDALAKGMVLAEEGPGSSQGRGGLEVVGAH